MSGLDIASTAVGFVSLSITIFEGCIRGFILLSTAQNFGRDADLLRCMIEWEQYRLSEWARIVKLREVPNRNLNWEIVQGRLQQLESLLTDTQKLQDDYELKLDETIHDITTEDIKGATTPANKGLRGKFVHLNPKFLNQTAQILHQSSSPWKRLRWAVVDKEKLQGLIQHIADLNDCLYDLLQMADREFVTHALEILLRGMISQTSSSTELENIKTLLTVQQTSQPGSLETAIAAAVRMKKNRLVAGFDEDTVTTHVPTSSQSNLRTFASPFTSRKTPPIAQGSSIKLSLKLLTDFSSPVAGVRRELALYNGQTVLLEWKSLKKLEERKLRVRIENLACLLRSIEHPSFHTLKCLGFVNATSGQYAYVFQLPELKIGTAMDQSPPKNFFASRSLLELLHLKNKRPGLNSRILLSIALAETVLQLHTSGWLHKGIRSESILFFRHADHNWDTSEDLDPVYLLGYEYARADNPLDITETPEMQVETEVYRHPALIGGSRPPFQKQFDLYSLGCVLLEIGLWSSLQTVLLQALRSKKSESNRSPNFILQSIHLAFESKSEAAELSQAKRMLLLDTSHGSIMKSLEFCAGKEYMLAVQMCLTASKIAQVEDSEEANSGEEEDNEDDEKSSITVLNIQAQVINTLRILVK